jgi:hypothetical protein
MKEQGTAVNVLVVNEPVLVIRPLAATLKYQTDTTASSQPEGVIVNSPSRLNGVMIREEAQSTGIPVSFIR